MPVVEDSKVGLFATPVYGNAGLGNNPTPKNSVSGTGDPVQARLSKAGLSPGGAMTTGMAVPSLVVTINFSLAIVIPCGFRGRENGRVAR